MCECLEPTRGEINHLVSVLPFSLYFTYASFISRYLRAAGQARKMKRFQFGKGVPS
jgi:hypothetical protein